MLATRSRTKMLATLSSSSGERLSASDANATKRPSPEMAGSDDGLRRPPRPPRPRRGSRASSRSCRPRGRRCRPPGCPRPRGCRAIDWNATRSPLAEMEGVVENSSAGAPAGPVAREIRTTSSLAASAGAARTAAATAASARLTSRGRLTACRSAQVGGRQRARAQVGARQPRLQAPDEGVGVAHPGLGDALVDPELLGAEGDAAGVGRVLAGRDDGLAGGRLGRGGLGDDLEAVEQLALGDLAGLDVAAGEAGARGGW